MKMFSNERNVSIVVLFRCGHERPANIDRVNLLGKSHVNSTKRVERISDLFVSCTYFL